MHICQECGIVFEEKIRIVEPHGEEYWGCPSCRSWDVAEAEYCDWCGEAHPFEDMDYVESGAFVCRRCIEEDQEDDEDG